MENQKTGLWFVGAFGGVAATTAVGLAGLQLGTAPTTGLVSTLPTFARLPFLRWEDWVVGGHEIRDSSLTEAALQLANESRAFDPRLVEQVSGTLETWSKNVRPGIVFHSGQAIEAMASGDFCQAAKTPRDAIQAIRADLEAFAAHEQLERLVVVNVASTEPLRNAELALMDWDELNRQLDFPETPIPSSSLYAIAALEAGFPHINFTPSLGTNLPAIRELAVRRGLCHMGRDGKTGETFLKSVLAPAFAARNLEVMSWVGHNIFGNRDGIILDDPQNKATKVKSKDSLLGQVLGYQPQTHTSIEYIRSLGDWKTAWDHIHFRGFLGTPMVMQITWQGCDSILAAPLVLDLARFVELAARRGEQGELSFLSSFFKSPQGTEEQSFPKQFQMLEEWAERVASQG